MFYYGLKLFSIYSDFGLIWNVVCVEVIRYVNWLVSVGGWLWVLFVVWMFNVVVRKFVSSNLGVLVV